MSLFGLLARTALLKEQLHTKPCGRCGLLFDHRQPHCPHCHNLDDHQLARLLERKAQEHEGNARLGRWLLLGAAMLAALMAMVLFAGN